MRRAGVRLTVLALKVIPRHDIATIELDLSLRESIVGQEAEDSRDGNSKADGMNPIVILVWFFCLLEDAELEPRGKVVVIEMPVFDGDDFCKVFGEELECAASRNDADGEVEAIEYQDPTCEGRNDVLVGCRLDHKCRPGRFPLRTLVFHQPCKNRLHRFGSAWSTECQDVTSNATNKARIEADYEARRSAS